MNNRIWILAAAILCVAIIALGLVIGILPKLGESATAELSRIGVEAQNSVYEGELARLQKDYEGLDDIVAELEELQKSLPADHEEADFIRQVNSAAVSTGVLLTEYLQDVPVSYGNFDAAGNAVEGQQSVSGGTLLGIPVSIKVVGSDLHALYAFLRPLQQGQRLYMLASMELKSAALGDVGTQYELTIVGYIYTLVDPAAATAPQAGEPTPTETPAPVETQVPEGTETPAATETPVP